MEKLLLLGRESDRQQDAAGSGSERTGELGGKFQRAPSNAQWPRRRKGRASIPLRPSRKNRSQVQFCRCDVRAAHRGRPDAEGNDTKPPAPPRLELRHPLPDLNQEASRPKGRRPSTPNRRERTCCVRRSNPGRTSPEVIAQVDRGQSRGRAWVPETEILEKPAASRSRAPAQPGDRQQQAVNGGADAISAAHARVIRSGNAADSLRSVLIDPRAVGE